MTQPPAVSDAQTKRAVGKSARQTLEGKTLGAKRQKKVALPPIIKDPEEAAQAVGLRYVSDEGPGISRRKAGKGWAYLSPEGVKITDEKTIARINSLAIPPAYKNVWICPAPNGHIQATGFDERGRKQYRYHPRWREVRDETKYARMMAFGVALPRIRQAVAADIAKPGLSKEKVLATVVQLLEKTAIRVGNEEYARSNKHYGLTTFRNRHAKVEGSKVHFEFKGKSGVKHAVDLRDRRLARIIRSLQELPGQELFQYVDETGARHSIGSQEVNAYLKEISGEEFTAKDFRTWLGTLLASRELCELPPEESPNQRKKQMAEAVKRVASHLGNTPTVCRKSYIHPAVLESYLDGDGLDLLRSGDAPSNEAELRPEEKAVLRFLEVRLKREAKEAAPERR